jgi:PhoU domain
MRWDGLTRWCHVTKLTRGSLDEREGKRAMEIISFTINLEHIGDIIDKNLSEIAAKKIKRKIDFSTDGAAELAAFHKRILDSLRIAFSVFMSGNVDEARKLISEKTEVRNAELYAAERHFERLRQGLPESIETTSIHLDVLRDLKRIHSHICSVAFPVLEKPPANCQQSMRPKATQSRWPFLVQNWRVNCAINRDQPCLISNPAADFGGGLIRRVGPDWWLADA